MSVLFTSDLHLGDKFVSKLRGYDNIQDHDDTIIKSIQNATNKRTHLWILGDLGGNLESVSRLKDIQCQKKIMVMGNHDEHGIDFYREIFDDIRGMVSYKRMWITHCPIIQSEFYGKKLNIHGHIHKPISGTINDVPPLGYPYFNVNWEYWERPVKLEEIYSFIEKYLTPD